MSCLACVRVFFPWISKNEKNRVFKARILLNSLLFFFVPCVRCYYTLFSAVFAIDNIKIRIESEKKMQRTSCLHGITRSTQCSKFISDFTFRSVRFHTPFSLSSFWFFPFLRMCPLFDEFPKRLFNKQRRFLSRRWISAFVACSNKRNGKMWPFVKYGLFTCWKQMSGFRFFLSFFGNGRRC